MQIQDDIRDSGDGERSFSAAPPGTPRWVKLFGIAFLILILITAVMVGHGLITGHGPFIHQMH
jgi:hypothetical protein